MNTTWNESQAAIRSDFAEFGHRVADRASNSRKERQFDRISWDELASSSFFKLAVPKQYGGIGNGWWDFAAAFEGLSTTARDLGFLLSIIAHMGAIRIITEKGSEEQKQLYLPRLAAGVIAATAATEESGGSDVSRIQTRATGENDGFTLQGVKKHITNAPIAEIFVIVGRLSVLPEKRDMTLFILDRNNLGLTTAPAEVMFGNETSPTGDIFIKNVALSSNNIITPAGEGLQQLYSMLTLDRLLYALVSAGYLEPILSSAITRITGRQSFKKPMQEHQYVQEKIVNIKLAMETSRLLAYAALDRMLKEDTEANLMASAAKYVGCESLWTSAHEFLQLHGHYGYVTEEITNVIKDTIATRIAGGTSEIQKVNIFNQLLSLHKTL
ncbi:Acyl-CoA dehydrogenase domain protein [Pseudomonas coronafaciens pv. oryzae]|uniref:acyl-CoA dehydrogenase family protein n=1 Tax=Pseudomonas coronafaciens TaxID=53409 RepID=UPI0006B40883|nr:acyl-CoA dehydrogenase family protein [Pseudomonas coronafaciens]KPB49637.1 Acyl-CoA dehydrogenase domain protein [Pseudomonas coronafaciens pv. oryzae]KPY04459.1 Acyl-CoA dehydrogenase domain protein [Pseudomonas coronafaciens pv. oryzae]RMS98163.1 Acyl-CoA dehydrogenase domain protein [Pseudomonas coronafaciens pv. oryzae]